jgi:hypothetical protein
MTHLPSLEQLAKLSTLFSAGINDIFLGFEMAAVRVKAGFIIKVDGILAELIDGLRLNLIRWASSGNRKVVLGFITCRGDICWLNNFDEFDSITMMHHI